MSIVWTVDRLCFVPVNLFESMRHGRHIGHYIHEVSMVINLSLACAGVHVHIYYYVHPVVMALQVAEYRVPYRIGPHTIIMLIIIRMRTANCTGGLRDREPT